MNQKAFVGVVVVAASLAMIIYAVETRIRIAELQRRDQHAQELIHSVRVAVSKLDARLFGPVDVAGDLVGHDELDGNTWPSDVGAWSSIFIWPQNRERDTDSARLSLQFRSPQLQSLLKQTTVYERVADASDPYWKDIYSKHFGGNVPQYWLLRPDPDNPGGAAVPVYKVSGANVPPTSEQMAADIQEMIGRCRPQPPTPETPETPQPPDVVPDIVPEVVVPPTTDDSSLWWLAAIFVCVAGLALGVALAWRKSR